MSFESLLTRIVGTATEKARKLLDLYEAGSIGLPLFIDAMSQLVDQARAQGSMQAAQVLRAYVEDALDSPAVVSPRIPPADFGRLEQSLTTIMGSDQDTLMQLERLVRGETTQAAHDTYRDTMKEIPEVEGWVRGLDSGACQLCRWWWRAGRLFHPSTPMPTHTGCMCHPVPTVKRTRDFQTAKQAERSAALRRQRAEDRAIKEDQ